MGSEQIAIWVSVPRASWGVNPHDRAILFGVVGRPHRIEYPIFTDRRLAFREDVESEKPCRGDAAVEHTLIYVRPEDSTLVPNAVDESEVSAADKFLVGLQTGAGLGTLDDLRALILPLSAGTAREQAKAAQIILDAVRYGGLSVAEANTLASEAGIE